MPAEGPPAATTAAAAPRRTARRDLIAGAVAFAVFALVAAALVALVLFGRRDTPPAGQPAPPLALTDQDGRPFELASLRGRPVLVFFGYTHCPDVCPESIGIISRALAAVGPGPRAVFVSIDPERDDVAAMKQYLRYLPAAFSGLTGSPEAVRRNADAWHVSYAKVEEGRPPDYGMAHTADIFLVDAQGRLRDRFPFGTAADPIAAAVGALLAETTPPPGGATPPVAAGAPTASPAAGHASAVPVTGAAPSTPIDGTGGASMGGLRGTLVSTSVWSGGGSPVILTITDGMGTPLDGSTPVSVRVVGAGGQAAGPDVPAVAIRPTGETQVSYVATLDIPSPGEWRLVLVGPDGATGSVPVDVLDPGGTARLGAPAPDVDTPTLDDVGGNLLAVSTLPQADVRLYRTSTADARAAGKPYVLVIDSARFKVSPACGRALSMIRFLLDRWTDVPFIHLEPFEYLIITSEPVLSGDLADPPLNATSRAFGLGDATWPATRMPWIFIVDGAGVVRAKYTGIVGSADVDVILSLISGEGVVAP